MEELKKPIYVAEVGTPLQKALVDNFEAQEQLKEVLDKYVQMTEERIVEVVLNLPSKFWEDEDHAVGGYISKKDLKELLLSLIDNKSDINN